MTELIFLIWMIGAQFTLGLIWSGTSVGAVDFLINLVSWPYSLGVAAQTVLSRAFDDPDDEPDGGQPMPVPKAEAA